MKSNHYFSGRVCRAILMGILICTAPGISGQKAVDFSGSWTLDHSKSAAESRDYNVTCNITQNPKSFSVEKIFTMNGGKKTSMKPITYTLDGKESATEEQGGTNKLSAKWSDDRKTLVTKYVRTMSGSDYGSITSYTLSADGRVLTVKTTELSGESPIVEVYKKK